MSTATTSSQGSCPPGSVWHTMPSGKRVAHRSQPRGKAPLPGDTHTHCDVLYSNRLSSVISDFIIIVSITINRISDL